MSAGLPQSSDPTGSVEDIDQEQPGHPLPMPPVPVDIQGTVPVHLVGSRAGVSRSRKVPDTAGAVKILNADPRRRVASIVTATQTVYIGTDQASVNSQTAALWPVGVVLTVTHGEEIWVLNPNNATETIVSVCTENWAD